MKAVIKMGRGWVERKIMEGNGTGRHKTDIRKRRELKV